MGTLFNGFGALAGGAIGSMGSNKGGGMPAPQAPAPMAGESTFDNSGVA